MELFPVVRTRWPEVLGALQAGLGDRPCDGQAWVALGGALATQGRHEEAAVAFRSAWTLHPHDVGIQCAYAAVLMEIGAAPEAALLLEDAVQRRPGEGRAYAQLAAVRYRMGDVELASRLWECAERLLDDPRDCLENLALARSRLGDVEGERRCWRRLQQLDPDSPVARHMLAASGAAPPPPRAGDAYLVHLFDRFAGDFDRVLARLHYRVPDIVEGWMVACFGAPRRSLRILDAGCGTGLCGGRLRPWGSKLVGVDLSQAMLDGAARRGVYDLLEKGELVAFLEAHPGAFDVVIAGDVLCYFGDLEAFARAGVAALRPEGYLGFSVERAQDHTAPHGYALQRHGRYAHARRYLEAILAEASQVRLTEVVLRLELAAPVGGYWVSARPSGSAAGGARHPGLGRPRHRRGDDPFPRARARSGGVEGGKAAHRRGGGPGHPEPGGDGDAGHGGEHPGGGRGRGRGGVGEAGADAEGGDVDKGGNSGIRREVSGRPGGEGRPGGLPSGGAGSRKILESPWPSKRGRARASRARKGLPKAACAASGETPGPPRNLTHSPRFQALKNR